MTHAEVTHWMRRHNRGADYKGKQNAARYHIVLSLIRPTGLSWMSLSWSHWKPPASKRMVPASESLQNTAPQTADTPVALRRGGSRFRTRSDWPAAMPRQSSTTAYWN